MLVASKETMKVGAAERRGRIDLFAGINLVRIKALLLTQCSFEICSRFPEGE
jgi:hypothetical protein